MSSGINNHPAYSPRFKVTVGGKKFQEPGGRIADLVVETTFDGADRFSFTLNYPFDEELDEFAGLDWDLFRIGTDVEIAMGYGDDGQLTDLLTGKIQAVNSEFTTERGHSVQVSGYGLLWEMMQGKNFNSWKETTIGDAIKDVLSSYSFSTVKVKKANIKRDKLIQDNRSDYQFIDQLTSAYGFQFYAERDTVKVVPRSSRPNSSEPTTELWFGEELHDFFGEITEQRKTHQVEVRSWDMENQEVIKATAGSSTAEHKEVFRMPDMSKNEAEKVAKTKLSQFSDGIVQAHGEADGIPELRAGVTVKLAELGSRFSGTYRVTNATHRMGSSGYRTTFEATEVAE